MCLAQVGRRSSLILCRTDDRTYLIDTPISVFRPGIIVGNAHTPAWVGLLGSLVPGPFGNIDQRILGRSIAAEIALHSREAGEVIRENAAMKKLATQFNSVTLVFLREV